MPRGRRKQTKELIEWKNLVKDRDSRKCVVCGQEVMLNAHHIIPYEIEEFRHDIDNGISLCPSHHKWGRLSAHKHALWFIKWLSKYKAEQLKNIWASVNV